VEGVGGAVVLAGLPDDRVAVVLAAVMDGHPDAQGESSLALGDVALADVVRAGVGDPEGGVELVGGLLGGPLGRPVVVFDPGPVVQVVGQVGVVVGPGAHLRVVGQVGDGMPVAPVVGVNHEGLGGQLLLV
jgi:hypothetical protein